MYNNNGNNNNNNRKDKARGEEVGIAWKLPVLQSKDLGKVGPAFGYGVGCGFGVGIGFIGGAGLGVGVPGLHFGVGIGAGCGVGLGFGYGIGRGWAQDENGKYSNVGRLFKTRGRVEDQIGAMFDDLVSSTRRAIKSIEKEIEKRTR